MFKKHGILEGQKVDAVLSKPAPTVIIPLKAFYGRLSSTPGFCLQVKQLKSNIF